MKYLRILTVSFVLLTPCFFPGVLWAERVREENTGGGPSAQERHEALLQKIDALTQKQDQILEELSALKAELNIIKIRVSVQN